MRVCLAAMLGLLITSAGLRAQTKPTTEPASATVIQLIRQLGSDSAQDRDAAQNQLVDIGSPAVPALKNAATGDDDPEIRSRASAAISQITDRDSNEASLITLHQKDAVAGNVLSLIAAQGHAQFAGFGNGANGQFPVTKITIDADRQPFWNVITDVCTQLNMCPMLEPSGKNSMRLFPTPRNWISQSPHQVVGAYWIGIAGMTRTKNIDLMGPPMIDDQFLIKMIVLPEPKLSITQISSLKIKQAIDDSGNSLMLQHQQPFRMPRSNRGFRQPNQLIETRLIYPKNPGKKISLLQGDLTVALASDYLQIGWDNVLGKAKISNPLTGCDVRASVTGEGDEIFRVTVECTRRGLGDQQWNAMCNRTIDLQMQDVNGQPFNIFGNAVTNTLNDNTFSFSQVYSKMTAPEVDAKLKVKVGDPRRLVWKVSTNTKSVTLPVTFRDLPMP